MLETNPFKIFIPRRATHLILGSFVAKDSKVGVNYDWYYSNGRNQFWPIIEKVYKRELKDLKQKERLFEQLGMAIADIILKCERLGNSSLDTRLINIKYNIAAISDLMSHKSIGKIFFTSRFVEKHFRQHFNQLIKRFPETKLNTLPSPSPRYALVNKEEKIKIYSQILPKLTNYHTL